MNKCIPFIIMLALNLWTFGCSAQSKNGFDLEGALIPPDKIFGGGPAKDGIPAIDNPQFDMAKETNDL